MKVAVSWSGGKDSLLALAAIMRMPGVEVHALVTTISEAFDRVSMHGVRRALVERQIAALGFAGRVVVVTTPPASMGPLQGYMRFPANDTYVPAISQAFVQLREEGVERIVFGDIFLEDLRRWRDELLAPLGLSAVYPLWHQDSRRLLERFVAESHRARIVAVNSDMLACQWLGRELSDVLDPGTEFPQRCDPCGENGEYHTFVYDGPLFSHQVTFELGEQRENAPFVFQDLVEA